MTDFRDRPDSERKKPLSTRAATRDGEGAASEGGTQGTGGSDTASTSAPPRPKFGNDDFWLYVDHYFGEIRQYISTFPEGRERKVATKQ